MKSVTHQGDVYNPSGTLEGGSEPNASQVLVRVQELRELDAQISDVRTRSEEANAAWDIVHRKMTKLKELRTALELKNHERSELESRISDSNAARVCKLF